MVLTKNRPFSYMFFLSKKSQKETYFHIRGSKECLLDLKSEVLARSKRRTFCKGVSTWFLAKIRPSSYMFFLSKQSKKETYFDKLDSKECFLDLKSETLAK